VGSRRNMASRRPNVASPLPPTLSAVRSSTLSSGSLASYPVTSSSFPSSPDLSSTQGGSPRSPDVFGDFLYTPDMDPDFQRIDAEAKRLQYNPPTPPSPTLPRDQKIWVVFCGKKPGIYDYL
jgi:hypothetical protein